MLVFIPTESDSARLRRRNVVLKLEAVSADFKSVIPCASHPSKDEYGNDQN
jgi:hypothetical protein